MLLLQSILASRSLRIATVRSGLGGTFWMIAFTAAIKTLRTIAPLASCYLLQG
jgi:hypothetical protein